MLVRFRYTTLIIGEAANDRLRRRCPICRNLRCSDLWFDKHPFERGHDLLAGLETEIAVARGVIAIGVGEGFAFPGERGDPIAYGCQQHVHVTQPRQVEGLAEVAAELLHTDPRPPP